jgi:Domain of unknown function (DUF4349)
MRMFVVLLGCLLLSACGVNSTSVAGAPGGDLQSFDIKEAPAAADTMDQKPQARDLTAAPQIAYSYIYGYRLSTGTIATVQQKHMALCDTLTPVRCRIVSMARESNEGDFSNAALELQIDSRIARDFGGQLDKVATDAGGEASNRAIAAEDLSKQMSDTAAKIRAKQALADRLMALLKNRAGKVGELVEAERAFAEAQEELDAARSWMAEMQGRVSLSKVVINYASTAPAGGGFWRPIRNSFASVGQTLGGSISALVTVVVMTAPWALLLWAMIRFAKWRGWRLRWPWRRQAGD